MAVVSGRSGIGEALEAATEAFAAAGIDTPRLDAEILAEEASGIQRAQMAADPEMLLEPPAARRFAELVRRRLKREPVAYIIRRRGFRYLDLEVGPEALIPRPETEMLVEVALELEPATVLDIGTGSGAIALAVADELPGVRVWATDTSPAALELARRNAARFADRGADRVRFFDGTLPPPDESPPGGFDLVLANLPYVPEAEYLTREPEITRFEPRQAVMPGPTGLEAIEAVLARLALLSDPPRAVALELGAGQAPIVAELVRRAGYESVESRPDLAGIERVVIGRS